MTHTTGRVQPREHSVKWAADFTGMASFVAFTVVTDDTLNKLNTDKIVASEVGATIGGITGDNFKLYLTELCQAVVTVSVPPCTPQQYLPVRPRTTSW
jgi:hypothetical protein